MQHCGGEKSPFLKGSTGWSIHPSVTPKTDEYIIEKKYSDSFYETNLEEVLKKLSVEQIVVCGVVTEGCVDTTIRRAYSLGYMIEVASDCHSTTDSNVLTGEQIVKHHNEVFKIFADVKVAMEVDFTN